MHIEWVCYAGVGSSSILTENVGLGQVVQHLNKLNSTATVNWLIILSS